jgi:SdiA-regulated
MQPIAIFLAILFFSCADKQKSPEGTFSYDLTLPDKIYTMPKHLKEISGLDYIAENTIACIEDKHGMIYIYDLKEENITERIFFGENGDYEDLSKVGEAYYVLRSDGAIFRVSGQKTSLYQTTLNEENNTEGLCYDRKNNSLLVACKDDPGNQIPKNYKAVYKFRLKDFSLSEKPLFNISIDDIILPQANKNFVSDEKHFSPSGIAIHPVTGNIFIISSRGNILIEVHRFGRILHAEKIYNKLFPQPEGICFTPEGDLMISNEGKDYEHGTVLRFKQKQRVR